MKQPVKHWLFLIAAVLGVVLVSTLIGAGLSFLGPPR